MAGTVRVLNKPIDLLSLEFGILSEQLISIFLPNS